MWEFSVGLYMINLWPDSLLLAAIYGVVESASTVIFGPIIGQWVDRLTYLKVWSLCDLLFRQKFDWIFIGMWVNFLFALPVQC